MLPEEIHERYRVITGQVFQRSSSMFWVALIIQNQHPVPSSLEAAVLVLPDGYTARLGSTLPEIVRPVTKPPNDRRQKWLELADVLGKRVPTESTLRTVRFLISLANEAYF